MIVKLFQPRFASLVESGAKLHTVRQWPMRTPKVGDTISLRQWTGAPYRSKQRFLGQSTIVKVDTIELGYRFFGHLIHINKTPLKLRAANAFARADGFKDIKEFFRWFKQTHGLPFCGIVIHWAPLHKTASPH